jgi:protein-disulfide isomerase/uncharacterized membrane protein
VLTPLLCLVGFCLSAYLTVMHFGLLTGDVSLGGACGSEGDCNSVVSSRYGTLLGLPVSVWGLWYYILAGTLSTAALLLRREDSPAFVRFTLRLTILALAFDAYLAWAMATRLQRFCPLCVATYGVNVLILLTLLPVARALRGQPGGMRTLLPSLAGLTRTSEPTYYREVLKLFLTGLGVGGSALVLAISLSLTHTLYESQKVELVRLLEYLKQSKPIAIPTEGLPARGPADAPISVVVFSDFMCEKCRLASKYFDIVAANHRGLLRIAYVNYPADRDCNPNSDQTLHPGACILARAANCAGRQGRFWEFHDAVFAGPAKAMPEYAARYARRAGLDPSTMDACMAESDSVSGIAGQIALAKSVGVTATPTSFINGRPLVGALRPWMLEFALKALALIEGARFPRGVEP